MTKCLDLEARDKEKKEKKRKEKLRPYNTRDKLQVWYKWLHW
jgi:hypothetical protein